MSPAELEYLFRSYERLEERQDNLATSVDNLSTRINTRVDQLSERMDEARETNSKEHLRVLNRLDDIINSRKDRIDILESQIIQLTARTAAELGKMRSAIETVDKSKRFFSELFSGGLFQKYRMILIVIALVLGFALGWGAINNILQATGLGTIGPEQTKTVVITTKATTTKATSSGHPNRP